MIFIFIGNLTFLLGPIMLPDWLKVTKSSSPKPCVMELFHLYSHLNRVFLSIRNVRWLQSQDKAFTIGPYGEKLFLS